MLDRTEREQKMLADFPKGAVVRVKASEVDGYITSIANKLRDRIGEITGHQCPTPNPIVTFHAVGRRKEYRHVFAVPSHYIDQVTDDAVIEEWRQEVAATHAKAELAAAKKQKAVKTKGSLS